MYTLLSCRTAVPADPPSQLQQSVQVCVSCAQAGLFDHCSPYSEGTCRGVQLQFFCLITLSLSLSLSLTLSRSCTILITFLLCLQLKRVVGMCHRDDATCAVCVHATHSTFPSDSTDLLPLLFVVLLRLALPLLW